jgi:hypothetical protein
MAMKKKATQKSSSNGDLAGDVGIIYGQGRSRTTQRVSDQTKRAVEKKAAKAVGASAAKMLNAKKVAKGKK